MLSLSNTLLRFLIGVLFCAHLFVIEESYITLDFVTTVTQYRNELVEHRTTVQEVCL